MKRLFKKLETVMMAVTFAEAGEFDTARQLAVEEEPKDKTTPKQEQCGGAGQEGRLICS